jgi:hypothetical protein
MLRQSRAGSGAASAMANITLHDFARDIAEVMRG